MNPLCSICHKPLEGCTFVGTGDNTGAHTACFEREHPPTPAIKLNDIVRGADPILASEVICELVPADLAERIIRSFNQRLLRQWLKRCLPQP